MNRDLKEVNYYFHGKFTSSVPQLMSVLLTEFMSAFDMFSVFVEFDFDVID